MRQRLDLQSKIILLGCCIVAVALLVSNLLISRLIIEEKEADLWRQTLSVARLVAKAPVVIDGLAKGSDAGVIQAYAAQSLLDTNVQFMTVMATSMPYIGRG